MYISTFRSWDDAAEITKSLLPEALATTATTATIAYSAILHLSKGPLSSPSFIKIIIAGLITAVFLRPLYRYLTLTCWRWGPTEVFLIRHWRLDQMKMLRDIYSSWRAIEFQQDNSGSNVESSLQPKDPTDSQSACSHQIAYNEADGSTPAAATPQVDLQSKYGRSPAKLASDLGISVPRAVALRRHLGIDNDESCCHEFRIGSQRHSRYSDKAFTKMREAVLTLDMEAIWRAHRPGGKAWPLCSVQGCEASRYPALTKQ